LIGFFKMNNEQRQQIKKFLDISLRRKKIIILFIFLSIVIGLGYYLRTPKIYRASSLIIYQQKLNPTQMSPDLNHFQEIYSAVTQQITSRTSLENFITQFNLYTDLRSRFPMEDVVEIMRSQYINIRPDAKANIFEVSFKGGDPRTVLLVTNALAAKFIEENIRVREETVSETSTYIQDELNMAKEAISKIEVSMRDYKLKYYNEMPERLESNISRLNALQAQYQSYQENLQDLERTKILLQEQINLRSEYIKGLSVNNSGDYLGTTKEENLSKSQQLANLKYKLNVLLTRYTEKHPDVKRIRILISQLEEEVQKQDAESKTIPAPGFSEIESEDPIILELITQLDEIKYNINKLNAEKEETLIQIEKFKKWIDAAPVREAEWTGLTRDYEQLSSHYDKLVSQNLQAAAAESLERRQKGSQFKIIDPAHYPETPFSPNFKKIMLFALVIGLGIGGTISLCLEFLDTSFRDAYDLEKFLGLPVSCAIPVITTKQEKRSQNLKSGIWISILVLSFTILGGGMVYLWHKGLIII
jgi:polysaccharide chain length determinant protein (PEP-CTERM system associated)